MSASAIVCDLDGVVYLGDEGIPGAGDTLASLAEAGHRLLFCTNNSSRTRVAVADKIRRLTGFEVDPESVLSSARAAARLVRGEATSAFVVGGDGIHEALSDEGIERTDDWRRADTVVVGLDVHFDYDRLAGAARAVRNGARLVATNHDATYPTPTGLLPGAGSIVAAVEVAAGCTAEVAGKPHDPMRRLVRERCGEDRVWVVGDRIDTDLAMAFEEGWGSVLVLTGVSGPADAEHEPAPDLVLDSVADLPEALAQRRA